MDGKVAIVSTGASSATSSLLEILAQCEEVGKDLSFLDSDFGEAMINISKTVMAANKFKELITLTYVALCIGFKIEKYHERAKLSPVLAGPIRAHKIFIPNKMSQKRKPAAGEVRMQQIIQAIPPITVKCMQSLMASANKTRVYSPDYELQVEYCWPGSLVYMWYADTINAIIDNIRAYTKFIESYIAKRAQNVTQTKARTLNYINRTWFGKLIDTYHPDTIVLWRSGKMGTPLAGGVDVASKKLIAKGLTWNPWAQIKRPDRGQNYSEEFLGEIEHQMSIMPI
jgi:hypothetical protein